MKSKKGKKPPRQSYQKEKRKKKNYCGTETTSVGFPSPSYGVLDYVENCRKKAANKMKNLKKNFDYHPKGINWKRKRIVSACTEADLKVMEKLRRARLKNMKKRKKDTDACKKAAMIARQHKKDDPNLCCDSDYRAGICDLASRILNADELDFADSELDYFPCKGRNPFPNRTNLTRCVKKKRKRKRKCVDPLESSLVGSAEALQPTRGICRSKKQRQRPHKPSHHYNYPYYQHLPKHKRERIKYKNNQSYYNPDFYPVPDEYKYYYEPKRRQSTKHHKQSRRTEENCLVCPLNCPYHTGDWEAPPSTAPPKNCYSRPNHHLDYSTLQHNHKYVPDFSFGRSQKQKKIQRPYPKQYQTRRTYWPPNHRPRNPFLNRSDHYRKSHRKNRHNV